MPLERIVFVDLETTGATATADRITEIGIVEVDAAGVREWSQLVNPQTRISSFIERLTGISNAMVATAPTFAELAEEVRGRLEGGLFVAHNARFDYGFLKNEFKRAGLDFRARVLCTVKLSRKLYPQHHKHSLDALIARHGLRVASGQRHRALGDAQLIHQFWQLVQREVATDLLEAALELLLAQPSLPPQLDAGLVDALPEAPGVYLFFGDADVPLFIGRSKDIRKRVLAHFSARRATGRDAALAVQVRRIDWIETTDDASARLKEAELIERLRPAYNLRRAVRGGAIG